MYDTIFDSLKGFTMLSVIVLLLLFQTAETLLCNKCSSSSVQGCSNTQKIDRCQDRHDQCFALTFRLELAYGNKTIKTYGIRKGCANSKDGCKSSCDNFSNESFNGCKVRCCFGHYCNDQISVPDPDELGNRRTRRFRNSTIKNRTPSFMPFILLFVIGLFVSRN